MQKQFEADSVEEFVHAAAPWNLTGEGYILLCTFDKAFVESHGFLPASLRSHFDGGLGALMCLNYHSSDVGPYHEVLFVPGQFKLGGHDVHSITKIYTSTWESVTGSRENWGVPAELAYFGCERLENGDERVSVKLENETVIDLVLHSYDLLSLPFTAALIPNVWRELIHFQGEDALTFLPNGFGNVHFAQLKSATVNPAYFPDINQGTIVAAFKITNFSLHLPKAEPYKG